MKNVFAAGDKLEIEHLEELLRGRAAEYEIFGRTPQDALDDAEIRRRIVHLKKVASDSN